MSTATAYRGTLDLKPGQGRAIPPPMSLAEARAMASNPAAPTKTGLAEGHALAIISKLNICLDEETKALSQSGVSNLDSFSHRKGQGLMELNRALSPLGTISPETDIASALSQLKSKIDENMRVLRLHISAVNEITGMLTDAIQKEESDGTYAPGMRSPWRSV